MRSENECYTIEYEYFIEKRGKIFPVVSDDSSPRPKNGELLFIAWVRPAPEGSKFSITIPEEHDGQPVSAAAILFEKQTAMPKDGYGIPQLEYLYISSNVRHIHIDTSISRRYETLGAVEEIVNILNECTAEISPGNPYLCVCDHGIYSKDMTELFYILSPDELFEVPMGVKTIGDGAGCSLKGMKKLVIPESVTVIKKNTFELCLDLEYADISAQTIESHAFMSCIRLASVCIRGCKTIYEGAFEYCHKLETAELFEPGTISNIAFFNCSSLKRIDLYLKEDAAPFRLYGRPAEEGTLLAVRSYDTKEVLFELVVFEGIENIFTENGFDLPLYDRILKNKISKKRKNSRQYVLNITLLRLLNGSQDVLFDGALARLRYPRQLDENIQAIFESYAAEQAEEKLKNMITEPSNDAHTIASHSYLELIDNDGILRLIDASAQAGRTELTAELMQRLHERKEG